MPEDQGLQLVLAGLREDMAQLKSDMSGIKTTVNDIQLQLATQRGEQSAGQALRKRLENLPFEHDQLKSAVNDVSKEIKTLRTKVEEDTGRITKKVEEQNKNGGGIAAMSESPNGRWVIGLICATAILCCLALAGGLVYSDVGPFLGRLVAPTASVPVAVPVPTSASPRSPSRPISSEEVD